MKKKTSNDFSKLSEQISYSYTDSALSPSKSFSTVSIALDSSKIIKKISKVWSHIYQSQPFSGAEANVSKPIHFHHNQLTIECSSPSLLNHLRFNQSHLVKQLQKYGFHQIRLVKLVVTPDLNRTEFANDLIKKQKTITREFSENSIKTIEACAQTTQTSLLNHSLNNLLKSLKELEAKKR